jgi:hypothetical protein
MSRRMVGLIALASALAATAPPVLAQGTGGGGQGPGNLQPCAQGQQPTPQAPCLPQGGFPGGGGGGGGQPGGFPGGGFPGGNLQPCAPGQMPSPQSPCLPPTCQPGQQPSPQSPCVPQGCGVPGGGGGQQPGGGGNRDVTCGAPGGGGGGPGGGGPGGGGGGGGGPGGGLPQLSGGFLSHVWRMNADVDSYDADKNVLNCTITKFLNLPKKFAQMDDDLIDTDAFVLFSATTKVFDADGKRVPKEVAYNTLLDNANSVKVVGKVIPPKSWQKDQDGTPTPTFRAKQVYITG